MPMPGTDHTIRVAVWAVIVRRGNILLVEFNDPTVEQPHHFNLPGGGVNPGETLHEAVKREVREETSAEVEVDQLLFIYEYVPAQHHFIYGIRPIVRPTYLCRLKTGSEPRLPAVPDQYQIGVRWLPLSQLDQLDLIPPLGPTIRDALDSAKEAGTR